MVMTMSTPENESTAPPEPQGPAIPNFRDDERARTRYATMLESRKKTFAREHESTIRNNVWAKRDELREELDKAGEEWERRKELAEAAKLTYGKAYPHHILKTRFAEPTGMENLKSFGAAAKLYNAAKDAWLAAAEAESAIRKIEHNENQLDVELQKALERAPQIVREVTESGKWLAEIHAEEEMANARARVGEVDAERAAYAKRLAAGQVSDDEKRLRAFGEADVRHVQLPLDGFVFVRTESYGPKNYAILRDVNGQQHYLPYDPRLEPLFLGVYEIARSGKELAARPYAPPNRREAFGLRDFFVKTAENEEAADEALREHHAWAKQRRMLPALTELDEVETQAIQLLTDYAATLKG